MGPTDRQKKNIVSTINNEYLILIIFILGVIGTACYAWGKYTSDVQNIKLKQTVKQQYQAIKDLNDSIVIIELKLSKNDTLISLQEPVHKKK